MGETVGSAEYVLFAGKPSDGYSGSHDHAFGYLRSMARRKIIGGKIETVDAWGQNDLNRFHDKERIRGILAEMGMPNLPPEPEHGLFQIMRARVRDRPAVEKEAPLFCQEYEGMHWRIYKSAPDPLDFDVEDQD